MTDPPAYRPSYGLIVVDALDVYGFRAARILLDGVEAACGKDVHSLPVPPGYHRVQVYVPSTSMSFSRTGRADTVVLVHPGQTLRLQYRQPFDFLSPGSLGPPPQKRNGWWSLIACLAVLGIAGACLAARLLASHSNF